MSEIIKPISLTEQNPERPWLTDLAKLYSRVFAGYPWFEVSVGPVCDKFSSLGTGLPCPCGCGPLAPAYPETRTIQYIETELLKPFAIGLLAISQESLSGFAWGFPLTGEKFAETKYKSPDARKKIRAIINPQADFFYISEVGVDPRYQGKGVGTLLTQQLAADQPTPWLLRTNQDSPMKYIAENKLKMRPVIAPNQEAQDPENPARIIYIKP